MGTCRLIGINSYEYSGTTGRVDVVSEVGKGTTFSVALPVVPEGTVP
jgi:hypothetical protein